MKINVVKQGKVWVVVFNYNHQYFQLQEYGESKEEAMWIAKMLRNCFSVYKENLTK